MPESTWLEDLGRYINPGIARAYSFLGVLSPEVRAEGAFVYDAAGERYTDMGGGYGVMVHGYLHPRIVARAKAQLDKIALPSRSLPVLEPIALARRLAEITPGALQYSFFCNSGAEANEAALKFARARTGRATFVSTHGAFHGKTFGALSVSGRDLYKDPFRPLLADVRLVPYGDADALRAAVDDTVAGVILEPIQGEGGVIVPPDGYLRAAREICDAHGAMLIFDEVQSGMGRTGHYFACEYENVAPDFLTVSKALGGGIMPIGACVSTPDAVGFLDEMPLIHTSTFGGGGGGGAPLATAVACEAIDVMRDEDFCGQAVSKGAFLADGLRSIQREFPEVISEVRGRGLMLGLETAREGVGGMLMSELLHRRVLALWTLNNERVLRMIPPIVIPLEALEEVLRNIREAAAEVALVAADL
ncbi:MAG: aspartate aminotransferase family protein [Thermaerobacter sp.]|nr:aspartate aminotransferase family protein [Thermaerobacter sp.]